MARKGKSVRDTYHMILPACNPNLSYLNHPNNKDPVPDEKGLSSSDLLLYIYNYKRNPD